MKYVKFSLVAAAITAVAITSTSAMASNVLTDPGFEDPASYTYDGAPFVGFWEGFSGSANASSAHDTVSPRSGTGHASIAILGDDNSFAGVFQSINVLPGDTVSAGFWQMTPDTSLLGVASEFRIEWHDAGGGEISRVTNDGVAPTNAYTLLEILDSVAPAGATEARLVYAVQTFGSEPDGGASSTGTVYLDDAYMTVVPEPTSIALLGFTGLAIATIRRRNS